MAWSSDPGCTAECAASADTGAGHGRIEERTCRAAEAKWFAERHPDWKGLRSVAAVTARRIDKKTGGESLETRYYIASLDPDPTGILAATRAHWGVESFHWTLDVTFDEDHCRTRKDASAPNFAVIRHAGYNILGADRSRGSLHRKRLRACLDPTFRTKLFFERREQHEEVGGPIALVFVIATGPGAPVSSASSPASGRGVALTRLERLISTSI